MNLAALESTAAALVAPSKGLLAADESLGSIEKRFAPLGIASTEPNRRDYRELLFSTSGLSEFISGVILFDETIRQRTKEGTPLPELLTRQGIIPGVKVDKGAVDLPGFPGEKWTQGLDGLRARLAEYVQLGARFTKWRAVISIGPGVPSGACLEANANALALFAALSQEAGLVPIVEPEVLMDGDHSIARCEEVMTATLHRVFQALNEARVAPEGMLLKTGMVLPGAGYRDQADDQLVAEATLRCLRRTVVPAAPGVVFLSGGQSEVDATRRLNAIVAACGTPWKITYSYGRALQDSALNLWKGDDANVSLAQDALRTRARHNSAAVAGAYSGEG